VKRNTGRRLQLAPIAIGALLVLAQAACTDDSATGAAGRLPIPTPVGGVIRQDCETIAPSDYFLSDDEENWFTQNCNRLDCAAIRGTEYRSPEERAWYLENCR
jgi:hypothetical protein